MKSQHNFKFPKSFVIVSLFLFCGLLVTYAQVNVGVTDIIAPVGSVDSGTVVAPMADVRNFGGVPVSFPVIFRIGAFYTDTQFVSNLLPGDSIVVTFVSWSASPLGTHITKCSTALAGDVDPANDAVFDSVRVLPFIIPRCDIGVDEILSPRGFIRDSTEIIPQVVVTNYGTSPESLSVWLAIYDADYEESTAVFLFPGESRTVQFVPWLATPPEEYDGDAWVELPGDTNPNNDDLYFEFTVAEPATFTQGESLPPSTNPKKKVKSGGSLTRVTSTSLDQIDTLIFAFKGNNTRGFLAYDVSKMTWQTKESIPFASDKKKRVKAGASLCYDGEGTIYALKGNNTLEFWAYSVSGNNWQPKKNVPVGAGKKVKAGAGLVFVTKGPDKNYVFCLKGNKTREFYAFDIAGDSWQTTLPVAPIGGGKGFGAGSCIIYDSINQRIYALKGSVNEFFAYDVNGNTWLDRTGMPFDNDILETANKKAKDGSAMTIDDSVTIYALKGGTQEFWYYNITSNLWTEMDTIPLGLSRKKVKGGGALAYVAHGISTKGRGEGEIYALKGNNTNEMWVFLTEAAAPKKSGVYEFATKSSDQTFQPFLAPDPCFGRTVMRNSSSPSWIGCRNEGLDLYYLGSLTIKIFDITGKLLEQIRTGNTNQNSVSLDFQNLKSGVYFLQVEQGTTRRRVKLVNLK